jgi:hypothetical protein
MSSISKSITARIAASLPRDGRVRVSELLSLDAVTPVVRGFLEMELEIAVSADLDELKTHFELPEEFENAGYRTLHLGLIHLSTMKAADASRVLDKAVDEAVQYLSTPRAFLQRLFASDARVLLDDLFLQSLSHLCAYTYFPDVLRLWAERLRANGVSDVAADEFSALLGRIDRGFIADHSFSRIVELLRPLTDLIDGPIPKSLLADFFRDKNMRRVAAAITQRPEPTIDPEQLPALLMDVHGTSRDATIVDRDQMLAELKAAGVVLAPQRETSLLETIEVRNQPALPAPHEN